MNRGALKRQLRFSVRGLRGRERILARAVNAVLVGLSKEILALLCGNDGREEYDRRYYARVYVERELRAWHADRWIGGLIDTLLAAVRAYYEHLGWTYTLPTWRTREATLDTPDLDPACGYDGLGSAGDADVPF